MGVGPEPSSAAGRQRDSPSVRRGALVASRPRRWLSAASTTAGLPPAGISGWWWAAWLPRPGHDSRATVPTSVLAGCLHAEALRVHAALVGLDHPGERRRPLCSDGSDAGLDLDLEVAGECVA